MFSEIRCVIMFSQRLFFQGISLRAIGVQVEIVHETHIRRSVREFSNKRLVCRLIIQMSDPLKRTMDRSVVVVVHQTSWPGRELGGLSKSRGLRIGVVKTKSISHFV